MPELPWQMVKDEIKKPRETCRLECIYYVRSEAHRDDYIPWERPEDTPFTKIIRNEMTFLVRETSISLTSSVTTHF